MEPVSAEDIARAFDEWEERARKVSAPWLVEGEDTDVDPYERMLEGDRAEER